MTTHREPAHVVRVSGCDPTFGIVTRIRAVGTRCIGLVISNVKTGLLPRMKMRLLTFLGLPAWWGSLEQAGPSAEEICSSRHLYFRCTPMVHGDNRIQGLYQGGRWWQGVRVINHSLMKRNRLSESRSKLTRSTVQLYSDSVDLDLQLQVDRLATTSM